MESKRAVLGRVERRLGAWIVGVVAVVVGASMFFGLVPSSTRGTEAAAGPRSTSEVALEAESAQFPPLAVDDGRVAVGTAGAVAEDSRAGDAAEAGQRSVVAELLARLVRAAETPSTFHAEALPVLRRLGDVAGDDERTQLFDEVVHDGMADPLVRGAVLLGLAPQAGADEFTRVFDAWMRDRLVPLELVRAATLAAVARGERSACAASLDLANLRSLPTDANVPFPNVYSVTVARTVGAHEAALLRERLIDFDVVVDGVERSQVLPVERDELTQAAESIVTRELLLVALGHRSLIDPDLEEILLSRANPNGPDGRGPTVEIRAAHFVVTVLASCNERYAEFVEAASSSSHPIDAGLARMMQDGLVGTPSLAHLADLQGQRHAEEPGRQALFQLSIGELAERLEKQDPNDDATRADFTALMREIATDEYEALHVRMAAMDCLRRSADWGTAVKAATGVLDSNCEFQLAFFALSALQEATSGDADRRASIEDYLRDLVASERHPVLEGSIAAFLEDGDDE